MSLCTDALTLNSGRNEESHPEAGDAELEVERQDEGDGDADEPVVDCARVCDSIRASSARLASCSNEDP